MYELQHHFILFFEKSLDLDCNHLPFLGDGIVHFGSFYLKNYSHFSIRRKIL
jgi:hypothetical protein